MKNIWCVEQVTDRAELPVKLYFETKKEAVRWYNTHHFCRIPKVKGVSESVAKRLLVSTRYEVGRM